MSVSDKWIRSKRTQLRPLRELNRAPSYSCALSVLPICAKGLERRNSTYNTGTPGAIEVKLKEVATGDVWNVTDSSLARALLPL